MACGLQLLKPMIDKLVQDNRVVEHPAQGLGLGQVPAQVGPGWWCRAAEGCTVASATTASLAKPQAGGLLLSDFLPKRPGRKQFLERGAVLETLEQKQILPNSLEKAGGLLWLQLCFPSCFQVVR